MRTNEILYPQCCLAQNLSDRSGQVNIAIMMCFITDLKTSLLYKYQASIRIVFYFNNAQIGQRAEWNLSLQLVGILIKEMFDHTGWLTESSAKAQHEWFCLSKQNRYCSCQYNLYPQRNPPVGR